MGEGRRRVVIERLTPEIDCGRFAVKRVVGEEITVEADVFCDGHDEVSALLLWRKGGEPWQEKVMQAAGNDRWRASFVPDSIGPWSYTVHAWIDPFRTWRKDLRKRWEAGQKLETDLRIGARLLKEAAARGTPDDAAVLEGLAAEMETNSDDWGVTLALSDDLSRLMDRHPDRRYATPYERELPLFVDRIRGLFSAWYEMFPRSASCEPGRHGTFADCERLLPRIAEMGFDVLYLPPVHPIGTINRKGKNNSRVSSPHEPGCPWAIGSGEGGHKALHPELGTLEDFRRLVKRGEELGVEMALDVAFQCAPDHPYVGSHREWFRWRPDGTIQYAENPPKKYEDVVPFDFESQEWREMWGELLSVFTFWIGEGVKIFRVDNPHTKPFPLWEWIISEVKREHPEVLFLAEAFTRPKVMYRLAKLGFSQSYTYFTWRNTRHELTEYLTELSRSELREFFRPNFWPNTPDILHEFLQFGGRGAFMLRLVLAATLSSNYGIYGPAYELCVAEALEGKEEYLDSEKYEVKFWERDAPGNLNALITRLNRIRREHPALQSTWNIGFHESGNSRILFYSRVDGSGEDILLVAVNLDPFETHRGLLHVPVRELGIPQGQPYLVHDLLSDERHVWEEEKNPVEIDPKQLPARIYAVKRRMRRENDFDYYM